MKYKALIFTLVTLLALSALWWLWPKPSQPIASSETLLVQAGSLIHWQVSDSQRVAGPAKFAVRVGDTITLDISSDHADELHIHGDDLKLAVLANKSARITWRPQHSGRFDMELHHSDLTLAQVDVLPR